MPELRELQQKLDSSEALKDIVEAMRNLAAIYVRRAEATLDAIRPYSQVTDTALAAILERMDPTQNKDTGNGPQVVVGFTSDQGLCGMYNERVSQAVKAHVESQDRACRLIIIGQRGSSRLQRDGFEVDLTLPSPSSLEAIRAQMPEMAIAISEIYAEAQARSMIFIYNTYEGAGKYDDVSRVILPPRPEQLDMRGSYSFRSEPILTAPPEELLPPLIEEYIFVELYRAMLESNASENGARLLAMSAAATNIEDRIGTLKNQYQSVRQDVITSELLDVVGGAEALRERD